MKHEKLERIVEEQLARVELAARPKFKVGQRVAYKDDAHSEAPAVVRRIDTTIFQTRDDKPIMYYLEWEDTGNKAWAREDELKQA